ncbi:MAG: protein-glutamate O-methyltransferase CheR [Pseudomonadota bacterium]|nr:protein-glutamate O-methyltransferase CheR [Pseudomonadota bacterium]
MNQPLLSKEEYDAFRHFLEESCGIVLGDNKHYLVTSRLNRLTEEFSFDSLSKMLEALRQNKNQVLRERIIDAMTTNETSWFRDIYPFEILKKDLLPELAGQKPNPLRIWSAASSYGQEAFSIAIAIKEFQQNRPGVWNGNTDILGTDISPTVIRTARDAKYDELSLGRGLSMERRQRYFSDNGDGGWTVKPEIRNMARFSEMNLLKSFSNLGKFDLIFCRNVLIYFSSSIKTDILNRMAQVLKPGGYLFLGGSESPTGYSQAYEMCRFPDGVVYRLKENWKG